MTDNEKAANDLLNRDLGIAMEMSTIGRFQEKNKSGKPKSGYIKVQVTSDSGFPQVHVHLARTRSDALWSCVKLDKAEYFLHDKYRSKLTREQVAGLVDFFNSTTDVPEIRFQGKMYKLKTMWDYTILDWNRENEDYPERLFDLETDNEGYLIPPQMPDYTKLN